MDELRGQGKAESKASTALSYPYSYREIASDDKHVVRVDVIEQLRANLAELEDLHGRLKFMMAEVRGLIRK